MIKYFCKNKKGYALLELLFYVAFFATFSLVVISSMIVMAKSFRETSIQGELVGSAGIMERISREIRQAYGINSIVANPGDLVLNTTDSAGAYKTVEFKFVSPNIFISASEGRSEKLLT